MRRWVQSVSKQGLRLMAGDDRLSPTGADAASDCDPCDFLTYVFQGLALVHGTPQELRRSTATMWFIIPSSPSLCM